MGKGKYIFSPTACIILGTNMCLICDEEGHPHKVHESVRNIEWDGSIRGGEQKRIKCPEENVEEGI